jgi:hypothetical protein
VSYVSVEHDTDVWVDAHVEKRWKRGGQWRLSVYYFVGGRQYYRTYDEDKVRPVMSAELQDDGLQHDELQNDEQRDTAASPEPPQGEHDRPLAIDLRDAQHNRRPD